jgi:anthranilate phosphoribosyltransferase
MFKTESNLEKVLGAMRSIGRGKAGAKDLSRKQSYELFLSVFSGELDELQLGAILMAFRMKGECLTEIQGAMDALHQVNSRGGYIVPTDKSKPVAIIPSYNGARLQPNLTPLLACLLADAGVQVIVHGVESDEKRVVSSEIFTAMGLPPLHRLADASVSFDRQVPAFIPIRIASPALFRLLSMRGRMGVRNIAHSLAKIYNPTHRCDAIRLTAFTHPEFNTLQHDYFINSGETAFVMRATEGECFANARRLQPIDLISAGAVNQVVPGQVTPTALLALPAASDIIATANWIQSVLAGERELPRAIADQVKAILDACYE